jgi:hypothetical protein
MRPRQNVSPLDKMRGWSNRNEKRLITLNIFSVIMLFCGFLLTLTFTLYPSELLISVHLVILASAAFIVLSLVSKGVVPVLVATVGIVLIHNAIVSPLYATAAESQTIMGRQRVVPAIATESAQIDRPLHFFLGVSMVIFGTIMANKPSMLFTRNRPPPVEAEWSSYSVWQDNSILADGRTVQVVPVNEIMEGQDLHLLWRYEYVLASIYGSHHLVKPGGMVPKDSTVLIRDKASGKILGKPRFTGFFI